MTDEEKMWAKVLGAILAVIFLVIAGSGLFLGLKALDDGPAHPPSHWR